MTGDRDLSAFKRRAATVPPPPRTASPSAQRVPAKAAAEPPVPRARRAPAPRPAPAVVDTRRLKVMTSIPAALHHRLRVTAEEAGTYKADIVLDALARRSDTMRAERQGSRLRRRRVTDATQCQLYLTADQRSELDGLAGELGLSRSDLVTRLLELHLPPDPQP